MSSQKILFSTVGVGVGKNEKSRMSLAESILKVIESENPDKIIFFSTEEADETVEFVRKKFKEKYKSELKYEVYHVNPEDFNECFSQMMGIALNYNEWNKSFNYTPGTKTMSAALAAVGSFLNAPIIYVSGKREGGVVKRGTERVLISEPYKFKDLLTLKKVSEFFNMYQFNSALFEARKLIDYPKKNILLDIINGYFLWDSFNHKNAYEIFEKYKSKDVDFIEKFGVNKGFLNRLIKIKEKKKFLLVDLICNAERRIKTERYDDAVARLYRSVELIAQIALEEYGYEEPIKLEGKLAEKYRKYEEEGVFKLGLSKKMELLKDIGWDIADTIYLKNNKMKDLLNKRNVSILAHGFTPVEKDVAINLLNEIEKFSKKIVEGYNKIKEDAKFGIMNFHLSKLQ